MRIFFKLQTTNFGQEVSFGNFSKIRVLVYLPANSIQSPALAGNFSSYRFAQIRTLRLKRVLVFVYGNSSYYVYGIINQRSTNKMYTRRYFCRYLCRRNYSCDSVYIYFTGLVFGWLSVRDANVLCMCVYCICVY